MTTLRPHIIRADTLDLQDQDAPSAKDHTRQPTQPAPIGVGPPAPHQNLTLRNVEHEERLETEALQEQMHPPRGSEDHTLNGDFHNGSAFYDDQGTGLSGQPGQQDTRSLGRSTIAGEEDEVGEQDGEDGVDDDMMDKISSSPSIDDGGYTLPLALPSQAGSLATELAPFPSSPTYSTFNNCSSSSPFTSTPCHFPLSPMKETDPIEISEHHHGEYADSDGNRDGRATTEKVGPPVPVSTSPYLERHNQSTEEVIAHVDDEYEDDNAVQDFQRFLLPNEGPPFDENMVDGPGLGTSDSDDSSWEDESDGSIDFDDEPETFHFSEDPRFVDSGWGGECLRDVEDIDFEFVYALHTFVATVEGQANATKGDTMVLLDDSNSYWWLVRVVKDGSIGYLPAEHIETPTERLARLNKHRNIDLSATMLGDNPEKSKNPLKKAMRRRNAKTVQFAAPQYFEPSDFDYSSDEEGGEGDISEEPATAQTGTQGTQEQQNDTAVVEPLRLKTQARPVGANGTQLADATELEAQDSPDRTRSSDEMFEGRDAANVRSRNGVVRNTDSFFKDDNVETKKISLTPKLLSEQNGASSTSSDSQTRGSSDTFDKITASNSDKAKDDKKRKDKKSGMLSGLFKRKDKKDRGQDDRADENEKMSEESLRASPQPKESTESLSQEARLAAKTQSAPQRQPSKLQKAPPADLSPIRQEAAQRPEPLKTQRSATSQSSSSSPQKDAPGPSSLRQVAAEPQSADKTPAPLRVRTPQVQSGHSIAAELQAKAAILSPGTTTNARQAELPTAPTIRPVQSRDAILESSLNDLGSDEDDAASNDVRQLKHDSPRAAPPEAISQSVRNRLSESPVQVSPIEPAGRNPFSDPTPPPSHPPPLAPDSSPTDDEAPISPISPSPSSSPDLVESNPNYIGSLAKDTPTPVSTATSTPTWSDASLRTYLDADGDADIRDLLIIVHDKSGVVPAGPDHPITGTLFSKERERTLEMERKLDGMLEGWLTRRGRSKGGEVLLA